MSDGESIKKIVPGIKIIKNRNVSRKNNLNHIHIPSHSFTAPQPLRVAIQDLNLRPLAKHSDSAIQLSNIIVLKIPVTSHITGQLLHGFPVQPYSMAG